MNDPPPKNKSRVRGETASPRAERIKSMCLAIPGKILSVSGDDPLWRAGKVSFGGIIKEVNLAYVPEADVGDYVMVHVGVAISVVEEQEAQQVFEYLRQMDQLDEIEDEVRR